MRRIYHRIYAGHQPRKDIVGEQEQMGVVFAMSPCYACGGIFSYNPHRVPSIRVNGVREPVCLNCMTIANAKRVEMGVEPHPIHKDAYDPIDETEL